MPKLLIPERTPTLRGIRESMCDFLGPSMCKNIDYCRECIFYIHAPIEPFKEWLVKYVDENCKGSK